ncbi:MAG: hypothetical protein GC162_17185 [Planctomycetes bacterium]|nr:hypothetical protein [Planctomycetota bacterium]
MNLHREMDDLLGALHDGVLTDAQADRLSDLINRDDEARAYYCRFIGLVTQLRHYKLKADGFVPQAGDDPAALDHFDDEGDDAAAIITVRRGFSWRWVSYGAAAAILLAAALVIVYMTSMHGGSHDGPSRHAYAILSDVSSDAQFADGAAPAELGGDLPKDAIALTAGTAQVMFESTAVVDLVGPCVFELTGNNEGRLTRGSMSAYVRDRAHGFTVTTPAGLRVTDLGTRFNLNVEASGDARLAVLEGAVRMDAIAAIAGAETGDRNAELHAGQIGYFDAARRLVLIGTERPVLAERMDSGTIGRWLIVSERAKPEVHDDVLAFGPINGGFLVAARAFERQSLNVGERLSLHADLRLTATPTVTTSGGLRFGLYTFPDASSIDTAAGYNVQLTTGGAGGWAMREMPSPVILGGAETLGDHQLFDSAAFAGFRNADWHAIDMMIDRTDAGVIVTLLIDGRFIAQASDDDGRSIRQFDHFVVGTGKTPTGVAIRNLLITHSTLPPPQSR